MTRLEQIEQEITKLNPEEFAQLRDWVLGRGAVLTSRPRELES
jgi:hypothetical protein